MLGRRQLLDSAAAGVLAAVMFAAGWVLAFPLAEASIRDTAIDGIAMTSPSDLLWHQLKLGVALALAPAWGWCAGLAYRLRAHAVPGPARLVAFYVICATASLLGVAARFMFIRAALATMSANAPLTPMITLDELSLAGWGLGGGLVAVVALAGWLAVTRRQTDPSLAA